MGECLRPGLLELHYYRASVTQQLNASTLQPAVVLSRQRAAATTASLAVSLLLLPVAVFSRREKRALGAVRTDGAGG
jgi:hypothetical protein